MMNNYNRWLPAGCIMLLIFLFSSIPNLHFFDNLPPGLLIFIRKFSWRFGETGFFSYAANLHPDYIIHKLGHIVLYGLLGMFLYKAGRSIGWTMLIVILFAVSDELHQALVAGRSGRFGDIVLDTVSAALFVYISWRKRQVTAEK